MIRLSNEITRLGEVDRLFKSVFQAFFSIPAKTPTVGDVTFAQMKVLWVLERNKSATLTRISKELCVTCPTANTLVNRLVNGGYIRRVRDAEDQRQVVLTLSAKGRNIVAQVARRRQSRLKKLFRSLTRRDIEEMTKSLKTLRDILAKWRAQ